MLHRQQANHNRFQSAGHILAVIEQFGKRTFELVGEVLGLHNIRRRCRVEMLWRRLRWQCKEVEVVVMMMTRLPQPLWRLKDPKVQQVVDNR